MSADKLKELQIQPEQKQRRQKPFWIIVIVVFAVAVIALLVAQPWNPEKQRRMKVEAGHMTGDTNSTANAAVAAPAPATNSTVAAKGDSVLTVSGYIINRERIEISPRFLGLV